ncbi:uncharacterized protein LOC131019767 [Salvia miltiorrhiza]|uniref:uncharacterized protein LOC131019767 n=1 Tax=Salvia miltiorrhiza TaxID=226208 RepID=UPI0025ABF5E5|nr:uncharacterized protein LOC131019767 [Salvia miltiorrhiza]
MSDVGEAEGRRDEQNDSNLRSGAGFNESALDSLADIAIRYICELGKTSRFYANLAGRTGCNVFDIVQALEDLGTPQGFTGASEVHADCAVSSGAIREIKVYVEAADEVAKWMLSKGQGATMATYDHLLLAFDMDIRPDEAKMLWNMILHAHDQTISKRLFSRMISLYDRHNMPNNVIEVFADMEELGVKPDEDTVRRIARAFEALGQEDKQKQFLTKYQRNWKYIHFKGGKSSSKNLIPRIIQLDKGWIHGVKLPHVKESRWKKVT